MMCPTGNVSYACLSRYDWKLELQTSMAQEEARAVIPFTQRLLKQNVAFSGKKTNRGFPVFRINQGFRKEHKIDQVFGKITWTYTLNAYYHVEVAEYHRWDENTRALTSAGFGFSLYATEWDQKMEAVDLSRGPRPWKVFPLEFLEVDPSYVPEVSEWTGKRDPDRFDDFFYWIDTVHKILDEESRAI